MPKGQKKYSMSTSKRARRAPKTKTMVRIARNVATTTINRMSETQDSDNRNTEQLIGCMNSTQWNIGAQCFSLTPNIGVNNGIVIGQGSGAEGQRKGNQIRTVKSSIAFSGVAQPYQATTNPTPKPFFFKWWIMSARRGVPFNDLADPIAIRLDFFESGSGTAGTSTNTIDLMRPINNEKYVVHKAGQHKCFFSSYSGSGGTGTGDQGQQANNDFKLSLFKKLDVTKYMPKVIRYIDNDAVAPTSKTVWFVCATYYADGTSMPSAHAPLRLRMLQDFKFKDF